MFKLKRYIETDALILREIRADVENNIDVKDSIQKLYDHEVPIVSAIRIIRETYDISLTEAKQLVTEHIAWRNTAQLATPLHRELMNNLDELSDSQVEKIASYSCNITIIPT
jgi:hypothetical protein